MSNNNIPTAGSVLEDKAIGVFHGAALGDALGGATEGYSVEQIQERWGGYVEGIVGPYFPDWRNARPYAPLHKGDGHVTDDTIMTQLVAKVYGKLRRHLTAYDIAEHLVPEMVNTVMWIPELEQHTVPLTRLHLAEKYLAFKIHWVHSDPREAGVGNAVNCGAAMYIAPVGVVNAGDPERAYSEAIDLAGAHQSSFGREAAGVTAAAVAEACRPGAGVDDVLTAAVSLAKDGTRQAIEAVLEASQHYSDWREAVISGGLRDAMRPFDTVADTYRDPGLGARRPSRIHAIEELPIALAMLSISEGDMWNSVLGGVNYGRDSDSIASIAGAMAGGLNGSAATPAEVMRTISEASRMDLTTPAISLAKTAAEIRHQDQLSLKRVAAVSDSLLADLATGHGVEANNLRAL